MIIGEDKQMKVELLEREIQEIIRCMEDVPYGIFVFMHYDKIIDKLKRQEMMEKKKRKQKIKGEK